ncbi:Bug family tripartite tricarboxylate transporter substrate binding protein [Xenophilus sp.]|uniref:Bug family tripartite tricarboxylate transporter substrate binding protein n=1 Tax=Xenophilus sp. TaxID=1873499 RepID=UPI0037DC5260
MHMTLTKLAGVIALPLMMISGAAAAAGYPEKPIRIIVPYPPGGGADVMARLVGQKLGEAWGQPVVVDNKPGADTQIGSELVAKAPPDGYTLGIVTPTLAINKYLYTKANYDIKDLRPVALIASSPIFVLVNNEVPATTLPDFIALAQRNPGKFNYAGSSSISFIAGESFKKVMGIDAKHIPYKGSAPAVAAVAGGEVQYALDTVLVGKPLVEAGKLRALAITARQRHPLAPDVPTALEATGKEFEFGTWYGFVAPAAVPDDIVAKFNQEVVRILAMPDIKKRLESLGGFPMPGTPQDFADRIRDDLARYGAIIKSTNLTAIN